ncbi:MAG: aminoacetone oxidase family FAD-binding enzyme [Sneathiella sp.]|uniref:TIGR03862 family flavoprotein n=1 Tax=Sneathiella sp. TaxID=1964365 RepID=UPI000C4EB9EF|nr:TIGR03862 family flavoprotein [Sneathiella sp.]MAZ02192.1 aminoacetone oxidase family FAD-binding enzyme [Sneathiella sp.]
MGTGSGKIVAIVGAGPTGLMAAQVLSRHSSIEVHLFDHKPSVARKFLIAGRGGLNLTHSEDVTHFTRKYAENSARFSQYLNRFSPDDMISWASALSIETFKGSSGRIFPTGLKATPLLRAWLALLDEQNVQFHLKHSWIEIRDNKTLIFRTAEGKTVEFEADAVLYAMGGGSYGHLGSDGAWVGAMRNLGVEIAPLKPSNCGFNIDWSDFFRAKFEGAPLKNIRLSYQGRSVPGDLVITSAGFEGNAIYALSRPLRDALETHGSVTLDLDLKPSLSEEEVARQLSAPRGKMSLSNFLRKKLKLSPLQTALLHEVMPKPDFNDTGKLSKGIKALPVTLVGMQGIARAISSAGGVTFESLTDKLMIKGTRGQFIAGEMLDWEAPTGGYLLQGCFATGAVAADGIAEYLGLCEKC